MFDLNDLFSFEIECLTAMNSDDSWLWHRKLDNISMSILAKVSKNDLVKYLPKIKFENMKFVILVNWANKLKSLSNL